MKLFRLLVVLWGLVFNVNSSFAQQNVSCENELLDIVIMIDRSGSISGESLNREAEVARQIIDYVITSGQSHHIGIGAFPAHDGDNSATMLTLLSDRYQQHLDAINPNNNGNLLFPDAGGGTDIASGIEVGQAEINIRGRANARKILFIISDGENLNQDISIFRQSELAILDGITIFSFAYESNAISYRNLMAGLASQPSANDFALNRFPTEEEILQENQDRDYFYIFPREEDIRPLMDSLFGQFICGPANQECFLNFCNPQNLLCEAIELDSDFDGVGDCSDACPLEAAVQDDADGDGFICDDLCPDDPNKSEPGVCGCGTSDEDLDNDGIPDCINDLDACANDIIPRDPYDPFFNLDFDNDGEVCDDECPFDWRKVEPGICGCGISDRDSDRDGVVNCNDECPYDRSEIEAGVCGCGIIEVDLDNNGIPDCLERLCEDWNGEVFPEDPYDPDFPNDPYDPGFPNDPYDQFVPGDIDGDGVNDCDDLCLNDPDKSEPGVCGCGQLDEDSDFDGTPDCVDVCELDPNKIQPGICGCGFSDGDSDGDGALDCLEQCPEDPFKQAPGVCGCGQADQDSDGDGALNCLEECPNDPLKLDRGFCGCGVPDQDLDNDRVFDCVDQCPEDPNKWQEGVCGCGVDDFADRDQDLTPDCIDLCPDDPSKAEPGICGCGELERDLDGDGVFDCKDFCPNDPNKLKPGVCGCGVEDIDSDGDGAFDCVDNCPEDRLKVEPLICGCGIPDKDVDLDGTPDCADQCPENPFKTEPGVCGCDVIDTDGDGREDCVDECPNDPEKWERGICGCGVSDDDTDGDGKVDCKDLCPLNPWKVRPGVCGCDLLDIDRDQDGVPDCNDECPRDPFKTEAGVCGCGLPDIDTDGDGVLNCHDECPKNNIKTEPGVCGCTVQDLDLNNNGMIDCIEAKVVDQFRDPFPDGFRSF